MNSRGKCGCCFHFGVKSWFVLVWWEFSLWWYIHTILWKQVPWLNFLKMGDVHTQPHPDGRMLAITFFFCEFVYIFWSICLGLKIDSTLIRWGLTKILERIIVGVYWKKVFMANLLSGTPNFCRNLLNEYPLVYCAGPQIAMILTSWEHSKSVPLMSFLYHDFFG